MVLAGSDSQVEILLVRSRHPVVEKSWISPLLLVLRALLPHVPSTVQTDIENYLFLKLTFP